MTSNANVHFSSKSDEWETPSDLFRVLDAEFHFDLDVCASHENHKCHRYFTKEADGLSQPWEGLTCWMNPPYSELATWMKKAYDESLLGATVVCLIPARTDTRCWHAYVWDTDNHKTRSGVDLRLIKGRLKFGNSKNSAPFPSAIVIFKKTK